SLHAPRFDVPLGVLVSAALLSIMVQLDTFACVVLMQKMDDAGWRRANMNMVSGGIRANALGNLLASGLGAYPNAVSSANLALCHISRSTSRWIGLAVAGLLLLLAFMPFVTRALRSEERRVGKECRARRSVERSKKRVPRVQATSQT